MSKISKKLGNASSNIDPKNLSKSLTKPEEEVAGPEISSKFSEMSTLKKEMGVSKLAVSTHSVSEMRQINMADNI